MHALSILRRPVITEKAPQLQEGGKYVFEVADDANKFQIKAAVEYLYGVKVDRVRTLTMPGKRRRYRWNVGRTSNWKQVYVTLAEGEHIDLI